MSDATRITRTVDTELGTDELWALVSDGGAWARWMVDEADVDVTPGAGGTVVDDGVERDVRIDRLDADAVRFTWWPQDRPELVSSVELRVLPAAGGSTLRVTETYLSASTAAGASASATVATASAVRWDVRLVLLLVACTPALV
jgi:hypothetical protein